MEVHLPKNFSLFGAKIERVREGLTDYTKKEKDCSKNAMSWFSTLDGASQYVDVKKDIIIKEWVLKKKAKLIFLNYANEEFFNNLFRKKRKNDIQWNVLTTDKDDRFDYTCMPLNERALFELKFAFGMITLKQQTLFLDFLTDDVVKLEGRSSRSNVKMKIKLRKFLRNFNIVKRGVRKLLKLKGRSVGHRYSLYQIDKNVLSNLCMLLPKSFSGAYYSDSISEWYPKLKLQNLEEMILFRPHLYL
jgi:hypothetical protein